MSTTTSPATKITAGQAIFDKASGEYVGTAVERITFPDAWATPAWRFIDRSGVKGTLIEHVLTA